MNRSGINSDTVHGNHVPTARNTVSPSSHHVDKLKARRVRSSTSTVTQDCTNTTGHVVSPRCSGNMSCVASAVASGVVSMVHMCRARRPNRFAICSSTA